jgi:hypothetical protein
MDQLRRVTALPVVRIAAALRCRRPAASPPAAGCDRPYPDVHDVGQGLTGFDSDEPRRVADVGPVSRTGPEALRRSSEDWVPRDVSESGGAKRSGLGRRRVVQ